MVVMVEMVLVGKVAGGGQLEVNEALDGEWGKWGRGLGLQNGGLAEVFGIEVEKICDDYQSGVVEEQQGEVDAGARYLVFEVSLWGKCAIQLALGEENCVSMEELVDGDEQDAQSEEWLAHVLDDVLLVSVVEDCDSKDE